MMTISSAGSPKNQHLSINMIFQYQLQLNIHENPTSYNAYFYEQRSTEHECAKTNESNVCIRTKAMESSDFSNSIFKSQLCAFEAHHAKNCGIEKNKKTKKNKIGRLTYDSGHRWI